MDVLLVDTLAVAGGAERALAHLAGALPRVGVRPRALLGEHGPLVDWLESAGCAVQVCEHLSDDIGASLTSRRTDVVLSVGARGHLAAGPPAHAAGVPAAWWMELVPNERPAEVAVRDLPTAAILAPSPGVARAQERLRDGATRDTPIHVVPPGIPVDALEGRRGERSGARRELGWEDRVIVGLVARIDRNKGQTQFLEAAARLCATDDRLRFLVVGGAVLGREGRLSEQLHHLLDRLDLGDRVRMVDHLDDATPLQAALDVAVNASVHESFGLSVLESMTLGTPVVATRTVGSTFLLDDGAAGWLCEPLDTGALATTIAAAVRDLDEVGDPGRLQRVRAASQRARHFDAVRTAASTTRVLRDVVRAHRQTARDAAGARHRPTAPAPAAFEPVDAEASVDLLAAHPSWTDSVFTTPAWWRAAVTTLAEGRDLRIAALRDGPRLVGLLGAVVDPERRLTRLVGDPVTDRTGPLHDARDRGVVAGRLSGLLDVLVPPHAPFRTDGLHADLRRADPSGTVTEVPCPAVHLRQDWTEYLAGPAARRRRRIASQSAELLGRTDVVVGDHTSPSQVAEAYRVLSCLHELRFGLDHGLFRGRLGAFLRRALLDLAEDGGVGIRTLHVGDRPAAAILLLRHGDAVSYYQGGWDPTFADLSVGRALFADTLRCEFERARRPGGPTTFELLRGVEPYKAYWADHHDTVLELTRRARDGRGWPREFTA